MRDLQHVCVAVLGGLLIACGGGRGDDSNGSPDACVGLQCDVTDCAAMNAPPTTISGTVFAPNGTLPLWNVNVYVPNAPVGAFADGAQCSRCADELPGSPVRKTVTDEAGHFTLENVPTGDDVPLVISSGKWRRQITIPHVTACQNTALTTNDTRLPRNRSEGDLPKIALSTGGADALECLLRKLGIDDTEIGTLGGPQRIHLFDDADAADGRGVGKSASGVFANSKSLWNTVDALAAYDIVMLSCEGDQHPETKSQEAMNAMKAYADLGGRVFASHWHNAWIEGSTQGGGNQRPAVWADQIATWSNAGTTLPNNATDIVDETSGHGASFATWLTNVGASPARGQIPIGNGTGKSTVTALLPGVERWVYFQDNPDQLPQNFQFTTPFEAAGDARCGKVVFSDMHVSGDSQSVPGDTFPQGCASSDLTPQEKALAFMFFDIASCVSVIF
ncbi:MAG: carboxypeptidase regulatory-like domain-containing protein [Proteobacteria bacterium]|nr:carboxypeptidase regulatory-like domain-containing protein [Pseudomonadota bacterium]